MWFNKTHINQEGIQSHHISKKQVRLPRDEDGRYHSDGEYGQERAQTTFKYSQQGQFCLGVASVKYKKFEPPVGKRCQVISYTGKIIIKESEWQVRVKEEIQRVKDLKKCIFQLTMDN